MVCLGLWEGGDVIAERLQGLLGGTVEAEAEVEVEAEAEVKGGCSLSSDEGAQ